MKLFDGMPDPGDFQESDRQITERDNINLWHMDQCREYNNAVWEPPAYECMCEKVAYAFGELLLLNILKTKFGRLPPGFLQL